MWTATLRRQALPQSIATWNLSVPHIHTCSVLCLTSTAYGSRTQRCTSVVYARNYLVFPRNARVTSVPMSQRAVRPMVVRTACLVDSLQDGPVTQVPHHRESVVKPRPIQGHVLLTVSILVAVRTRTRRALTPFPPLPPVWHYGGDVGGGRCGPKALLEGPRGPVVVVAGVRPALVLVACLEVALWTGGHGPEAGGVGPWPGGPGLGGGGSGGGGRATHPAPISPAPGIGRHLVLPSVLVPASGGPEGFSTHQRRAWVWLHTCSPPPSLPCWRAPSGPNGPGG